MNILLVRVATDQTKAGGRWNGPVDSETCEFAYVAIPEGYPVHPGLEKPYSALKPTLATFGKDLPSHLSTKLMHLDPDFAHLTYGDVGQRAKQLQERLKPGDRAVFYAGLRDVRGADRLVYAIIGLFVVEELILAVDVPVQQRDMNAHSRRVLDPAAKDLVVCGRPEQSGRLTHCVPIGEWRDRAYRARRDLLDEWGDLSVTNGYLQRSARLPRVLDPIRFLKWLEQQRPTLIQANN